jgi:NAD(P)-dependent dehydrogenase (short-subunit alcohol dehydrogenase family)
MSTSLPLQDKTAVIYGAGGAIGHAVARTFAREGARLFLTGRTLSKAEVPAKEIVADGGVAEAALIRDLSVELAPYGVRVAGVRTA